MYFTRYICLPQQLLFIEINIFLPKDAQPIARQLLHTKNKTNQNKTQNTKHKNKNKNKKQKQNQKTKTKTEKKSLKNLYARYIWLPFY